MGRRTVLLIVAIVVAAMGTGLVFAYVNRTDERALKDQRPVRVLVATKLIKAGTLGSAAETAGSFTQKDIPLAATIKGYLENPRPIAALVAVSDIFPGEQIIPEKFVAAGTSSVLPIPPGKVAMSVQLGDPERVAGFVRPGSEVAIMVSLDIPEEAQASFKGSLTRMLLSRLTVLAVGPTTLRPATDGQGNNEALPTAILTLAVDQRQAQKLAFAVGHGKLYFTLLTKDSKVGPGEPIHIDNLFS